MPSNLFIRYRPSAQDNKGVQLKTLGESLIGFEEVIEGIFAISKIKGDIGIRATKESEGSLVIEICIQLITHTPFEKIPDLLDFLKVADISVYQVALDYFSNTHRTLNDYVASNPVDAALVTYFTSKMIAWARRQKRLTQIAELPSPYAKQLHKLIKRKKFKKALKPFIEDEVSGIDVSPQRSFEQATTINTQNFEDYLSENEKILPELQNGSHHTFTGKIVGLQTARGESMKFEVDGLKRSERLLVAFPPDGRTTADYTHFYDKVVQIDAEIVRRSLYQKPQLIIHTIDYAQTSILPDEG